MENGEAQNEDAKNPPLTQDAAGSSPFESKQEEATVKNDAIIITAADPHNQSTRDAAQQKTGANFVRNDGQRVFEALIQMGREGSRVEEVKLAYLFFQFRNSGNYSYSRGGNSVESARAVAQPPIRLFRTDDAVSSNKNNKSAAESQPQRGVAEMVQERQQAAKPLPKKNGRGRLLRNAAKFRRKKSRPTVIIPFMSLSRFSSKNPQEGA